MSDADKTRMIGLLYGGKKTVSIYSAIIIWYRNVTDRQTVGQNCYINIARQCADVQ